MHELLAQWILKYMQLEKSKGVVAESESVTKLFQE